MVQYLSKFATSLVSTMLDDGVFFSDKRRCAIRVFGVRPFNAAGVWNELKLLLKSTSFNTDTCNQSRVSAIN